MSYQCRECMALGDDRSFSTPARDICDSCVAVIPRETNRPITPDHISDEHAMLLIQGVLSADEWSPDTLNAIADIVRLTGREIAEQE